LAHEHLFYSIKTNHELGKTRLERRELDPAAAGPAAGEDGAVDEAVAGGADAEVELVELAVAGLVAVALDVGLEAGALADGALDLGQRVVAAVGVDAGGGERGEDAELVAEAERRLEVAVLVEDVGGAGAVLLPLVAPEAEPVVGRARQRRPLGAQAAQQVAHLQCTHPCQAVSVATSPWTTVPTATNIRIVLAWGMQECDYSFLLQIIKAAFLLTGITANSIL